MEQPGTQTRIGVSFERFSSTVDIGSFEIQPPREPVIEWSNPENIFVGTALGDAQLNANSDAAGTFSYTPNAGTVLNLGDLQILTVQFTPDDSIIS